MGFEAEIGIVAGAKVGIVEEGINNRRAGGWAIVEGVVVDVGNIEGLDVNDSAAGLIAVATKLLDVSQVISIDWLMLSKEELISLLNSMGV